MRNVMKKLREWNGKMLAQLHAKVEADVANKELKIEGDKGQLSVLYSPRSKQYGNSQVPGLSISWRHILDGRTFTHSVETTEAEITNLFLKVHPSEPMEDEFLQTSRNDLYFWMGCRLIFAACQYINEQSESKIELEPEPSSVFKALTTIYDLQF
jgi:hypothetical protein